MRSSSRLCAVGRAEIHRQQLVETWPGWMFRPYCVRACARPPFLEAKQKAAERVLDSLGFVVQMYAGLQREVVGDDAFGLDGLAVEACRFELRAFGGVFGGLFEHRVA
jgi:hypothetical protein